MEIKTGAALPLYTVSGYCNFSNISELFRFTSINFGASSINTLITPISKHPITYSYGHHFSFTSYIKPTDEEVKKLELIYDTHTEPLIIEEKK